jgi:hypothetical protein
MRAAERAVVALLLACAGEAELARADEPARRLPPVATVCRRLAPPACWSEPGESRCEGATVFRIVIAGPRRPDPAEALADCRRSIAAAQ